VAEAAFRRNGQRMTQPRKAVMGVLAVASQPLKAEEIRRRAGLAETDLVTVYRNLEALREHNLLQGIVLEDGVQLFEAVRPDRHFHHIVCRRCHRAEPLEICTGHELEERAAALGFTNVSHVIEVFGLCRKCHAGRDSGQWGGAS
jgi:Fe2+ or Zn2+ uptake regulation protein